MGKKENKKMQQAIRQAAFREGLSEAEARREMEQTIRQAITLARLEGDQEALAKWASIPSQGEIPTPEEVIVWAAAQIGPSAATNNY